ncbi:MAG TPA: MBOAT family O-acyltransferase [Oscillospiraceae bacterium]|nr:MBOAT family O-acyltransferase [Oscillospiraceae bacterium]
MAFTSLRYFIFLPGVVLARRLVPARFRPALLLAAGYAFCLLLSPACAITLFGVTLVAYAAGRLMAARPAQKRLFAALALLAVLGLLGFLKYYDFFASLVGAPALALLLPAGLSFFTFQAAGYVVDVYRGEVPAERDFFVFALFLAFFPQVTSGPIGRAGALLPQLRETRPNGREDLAAGVPLFLWGLFKKLVVADSLAVAANAAFAAPSDFSSAQLIFASLAFTFQIYCDFSGYTDMARGSARCLGVDLMRNFDAPYFSTSVRDFWRRWHISLSTWFRDYLYIPLGGSRKGKARTCLNLLVVFAVSGLWHGAAVTFVLWGALHGLFLVAGVLTRSLREKAWGAVGVRAGHPLRRFCGWALTFALVSLAWIFFKAASASDALYILGAVLRPRFVRPLGLTLLGLSRGKLLSALLGVLAVLAADAVSVRRDVSAALQKRVWLRYAAYFVLVVTILIFGSYGAGYNPQDFIYFKF